MKTNEQIIAEALASQAPRGLSGESEMTGVAFGFQNSNPISGASASFPYGAIWNFGIIALFEGSLEIADGTIMAGGQCINVPGAVVSMAEAGSTGAVVCAGVEFDEAGDYIGSILPDLFSEADAFAGVSSDGTILVPLFKVSKDGDPAVYELLKDYIHGMAYPQLYSLATP